VAAPAVPVAAPETSDSSSENSSSSSEDEKPAPAAPAKPLTNGSVKAKSIANRPRSPSPPYFSFSEAHVLHSEPAATPADPEQDALRAFYLEKVVNAYGKELDAFKQEPGIETKLDKLVKSLASGADLMTTSRLAASLSLWGTKDGATGEREVFLQSKAAEPAVEQADVEME
jgi:hypothetical protein